MSAPTLQTPPKFHEETPRERRKNEISGGREQKKREILGSPNLQAPTLRSPPLRAPHPVGPPTPLGPPPSGPQLRAPTLPGPHQNKKLAKCGLAKFGQQKLAKFGQIRMAKCGQLTLAKCGIGQIRFGQMRPNKDGQIRFGQMRSRPPEAAGASHDSPRALMCTGPRPSTTPPKFNEKTPRVTQKERNGGLRGEKRAKFWAVRRRRVQWRGSCGRWSSEVQNNNHNNHNHDHNNAKPRISGARRVGPRRVGPLSQGSGFGSVGFGVLV